MKGIAFVLLVALTGCATPTPESFRVRGMDLYVEGGADGRFSDNGGSHLRAGVSFHFDFEYEDEFEAEE